MNMNPKQLIHALADLDKKAEEFDQTLRNLRSEIHNILWDLIELEKGKKNE